VRSESPGILRQCYKDTLGNVFSGMCVANHAQGGGVNEINVPSYKFSECSLRLVFSVVGQELIVGQVIHSWYSTRRNENRTVKGDSKACQTGA
jgi:hypothetical protein